MSVKAKSKHPRAEYWKAWHNANRAKHNAQRRARRAANRPSYLAKRRAYYAKNAERERARVRKGWWNNHPLRIAAKNRARSLLTPEQKRSYAVTRQKWRANNSIVSNLRGRLCRVIQRQMGFKTDKTLALLGCSMDDFRIYLESKFESGMTWDNYGKGGWEIDHIIPCAIFDFTNPDHQRRCFHFSNLQPLWAIDNRRKGSKFTNERIEA